MNITLNIPAERIANLFTSAMEGGDPVTTANKGGWCSAINWKSRRKPLGKWWYATEENFTGTFLLEVVEVDDENTGHKTKHVIHQGHVSQGFKVMAEKFPSQFAQVLEDNIDAPCADAFLQSILFGEEKYA